MLVLLTCDCVKECVGLTKAIMNSLGKRHGAFGGWVMAAGKVKALLLVVSGLDVDGSAEVKLVNMYVNMKECDMGRGDGPGKPHRVVTVEVFKEKEKEIIAMSP